MLQITAEQGWRQLFVALKFARNLLSPSSRLRHALQDRKRISSLCKQGVGECRASSVWVTTYKNIIDILILHSGGIWWLSTQLNSTLNSTQLEMCLLIPSRNMTYNDILRLCVNTKHKLIILPGISYSITVWRNRKSEFPRQRPN